MDMDDWRVTALEPRDVGRTFDASGGARTIMKTLLAAGMGTDNPHPPAQVELSYCGRLQEDGLIFDDKHAMTPAIFDLNESSPDPRFSALRPTGLARAVRTMRLGERAKVLIRPEVGFGEGDEALGAALAAPNA